jgi:hypothetical protein
MVDTGKRMKLKMALRDIIRNMSDSDSYEDYEEDDELEDEVMSKGRYSNEMNNCTHLDEPFAEQPKKSRKK